MTKRQIAAARKAAFRDAPYRVYSSVGSSIRTFDDERAAIGYAWDTGGTAYKGTLADMAAGTAEQIS